MTDPVAELKARIAHRKQFLEQKSRSESCAEQDRLRQEAMRVLAAKQAEAKAKALTLPWPSETYAVWGRDHMRLDLNRCWLMYIPNHALSTVAAFLTVEELGGLQLCNKFFWNFARRDDGIVFIDGPSEALLVSRRPAVICPTRNTLQNVVVRNVLLECRPFWDLLTQLQTVSGGGSDGIHSLKRKCGKSLSVKSMCSNVPGDVKKALVVHDVSDPFRKRLADGTIDNGHEKLAKIAAKWTRSLPAKYATGRSFGASEFVFAGQRELDSLPLLEEKNENRAKRIGGPDDEKDGVSKRFRAYNRQSSIEGFTGGTAPRASAGGSRRLPAENVAMPVTMNQSFMRAFGNATPAVSGRTGPLSLLYRSGGHADQPSRNIPIVHHHPGTPWSMGSSAVGASSGAATRIQFSGTESAEGLDYDGDDFGDDNDALIFEGLDHHPVSQHEGW